LPTPHGRVHLPVEGSSGLFTEGDT